MAASNFPTALDTFSTAKSQISPRERNKTYNKIVDAMKAVQLGLGLNFSKRPFTTKTDAYTLSVNDHTVFADTTSDSFTLTLPSAASCAGYSWKIVKTVTANVLTVSGVETINGSATKTASPQWTVLTITSDGTVFYSI